MQLTWERIVPDAIDPSVSLQRELLRQHTERYEYAGRFLEGRTVLDAACGAGFGSAILRDQGAARVIGLDIDEESIGYAGQRYGGSAVEFQTADLEDHALDRFQFGAIVSFETIEHLSDAEGFLRRAASKLAPDGLLIASVPTVPTLDINEFHRHDFTQASWRQMVQRCGFRIIDELPQRYCASLRELREDQRAPNSPSSGARKQPVRYYLSHPLALMSRVTRTLRYGMEFEVLTLTCSPSK